MTPMLSDHLRLCCPTAANQPHTEDCEHPTEPLPDQQRSQGVDVDHEEHEE